MITNLDHIFIDTIPDELEEGFLYVSLRFRVIIHSCCCGCKNKVVTPLSPVRWKMTFDGKSISLSPSIGNWNFNCQSHYWIKSSKVVWAGKWTEDEVAEGKSYEREKRAEYYKGVNKKNKEEKTNEGAIETTDQLKNERPFLSQVKKFFEKIRNW